METIYQLIPKVMKDLGPVGMTEKNTQQGYSYRSIHQTIDAISPILSKHGVFPVPTVLECDQRTVESKKGYSLNYSRLKVEYKFYGPNGDHVSAVVEGEGMDSGDKGVNKALSACYKYALGQVFCIPFGFVDSEIDSPEGAVARPKKKYVDARDEVPEVTSDDLGDISGAIGKRNKVLELGKEKGFSPAEIMRLIKEDFGKSLKDLSEDQLDKLVVKWQE